MTNLAAQLTALQSIVGKLETLNPALVIADLKAIIEHPTLSGALETAEANDNDAATIAGLIPGGQSVALILGLMATACGIADKLLTNKVLDAEIIAAFKLLNLHLPPLFAVQHGHVKPIFGQDDGQDRVFGFTIDP